MEAGLHDGLGQRPRERTIAARDLAALEREISRAKVRFGLPPGAVVVSCYEASRDGFWLHRYLVSRGVVNHVVDSASIEVNRRRRRAKSDRLDVGGLLRQLVRQRAGERKVFEFRFEDAWGADTVRRIGDDTLALAGQAFDYRNYSLRPAPARLVWHGTQWRLERPNPQ